MSLGFDGDNISLSILRTGVKLESGWRIIPLYDPIVSFLLYIYNTNIAHLMQFEAKILLSVLYAD